MKKLYKVKSNTVTNELTKLKSDYMDGWCLNLQAVFYSSKSPQQYLHLFDSDGDEFMFRIPGQAVPRPTTPEIPISVKLPLYYVDTEGDNEIIVWGEVDQVDKKLTLESSF